MELLVVSLHQFGNSPLVNDGAYNEYIKADVIYNKAASRNHKAC
jgi:hypothetical protein